MMLRNEWLRSTQGLMSVAPAGIGTSPPESRMTQRRARTRPAPALSPEIMMLAGEMAGWAACGGGETR
jgi:hypothetical protein